MQLKDKLFILPFHPRNTIDGASMLKQLLAGIAYTKDVVKYMEILITTSISVFLFLTSIAQLNKVSWAGPPHVQAFVL